MRAFVLICTVTSGNVVEIDSCISYFCCKLNTVSFDSVRKAALKNFFKISLLLINDVREGLEISKNDRHPV